MYRMTKYKTVVTCSDAIKILIFNTFLYKYPLIYNQENTK